MTILISDNSPRISYTATAGQTVFTVPFEFFDNSDLNVYINDVLQTITTNYTVAGGDGSTGTVTLVTGATVGDVVVITRDVTLERVTDFPTSGPFQVASLNVELDKLVAMVADLQDLANRGLRLSDSDVTERLTLAATNERKGTVLAFNATTGAVEVGPTIADTNTVAQIKADIATVAGISANVTTVAGISANVTTVAGVSSDVTTVAGQTTNMQNITDNLSAVQNAATNATNAATSASNAASSETAAASSASSAATSEANAATSATNASNSASSASSSASTATTKASEAATSATNAATSETNAGASATAAASSASSASTSASNAATSATNASSSASSASSAQTAAEAARDSALAAFDNFDDKYLGEKASDPTLDNDGDALVAGALYFNTTDDVMKVYTGSAWVASYVSGDGFASLTGATFTGDVTVPNLITAGNVDGRDVSVDGTKLDGIEALADVTDTANVTSAGAAMLTGATFTGGVTATTFTGDGSALTNLPSGGKVLQVKNFHDTSHATYAVSVFTATPLSLSFTPLSSTSKLYITVNTFLGSTSGSGEGVAAKLYRDGSVASQIGPNTFSAHGAFAGYTGDTRAPAGVSFTVEESLGSTSAVTYNLRIRGFSSSFPVGYNRGNGYTSDTTGHWTTTSSITVIEVEQ